MKAWIARDCKNNLAIFFDSSPAMLDGNMYVFDNGLKKLLAPDDPIGDGLTVENSPKKIELVRRVDFWETQQQSAHRVPIKKVGGEESC